MPEGEQRLSEEAVQGEDEVLQRAAEAEEGTGQEATGGNGVWQLSSEPWSEFWEPYSSFWEPCQPPGGKPTPLLPANSKDQTSKNKKVRGVHGVPDVVRSRLRKLRLLQIRRSAQSEPLPCEAVHEPCSDPASRLDRLPGQRWIERRGDQEEEGEMWGM